MIPVGTAVAVGPRTDPSVRVNAPGSSLRFWRRSTCRARAQDAGLGYRTNAPSSDLKTRWTPFPGDDDQARFPHRHLDRVWSLCLPTGPLISIPIRGERRFERQGADRTRATSTPTRQGVGGGAAAATIEQQRPPACRPDFCSVAGPATTSGLLLNPAKPKEKRATMHKMPRAVLVVRGSGSAADFA